ncbi:MAG: SMC family ATPase [Balneolia bacterium]|nr:SMC family ATPase [Balneolia bacterium]
MLPKKLTIQGLYSYQKKQTIDFDRLLDSQLFGIFGTVGSGKSSVLEAISFAIYGETERLNQRENRNYNMMNLKSDELLIDFECVNHLNENWRFIVQGKRAGTDFETVRTFTRRILKFEAGGWKALEDADPAEIIGLSYDNFRRTIIIPQGKFQEFLQLGDSDRTRMLKEIFSLERFEFSRQTGELIKTSNEKRENLSGQMVQYAEVTTEAITLQEQKETDIRKELGKARVLLKEKEATFERLKSLKSLFEEREHVKAKLIELQSREQEMLDHESELRRYERCFKTFSQPLADKDRLAGEVEKRRLELTAMTQQLEELGEKLTSINQQWNKTHAEYVKRDERRQQATDLESIIQIKETEAKISELAGKLTALKSKQDSEREQIKSIKGEKKELESDIEKSEEFLANEKQLYELEKWYSKQDDIRANLDTKSDAIKDAEQNLAEIHQNLKKGIEKCNDRLGVAFDEGLSIESALEQLERFQQDLAQEEDELRRKQQQLVIHQKLGEFAEKLEHGSACPLCGSEEHPNPYSSDQNGELKSAESRLEQIKQLLTDAGDFKDKFTRLAVKSEESAKQHLSLKNELSELDDLKKSHLKAFIWTDFDTSSREKFNAEVSRMEAARKEIASKQNLLKELSQKGETLEASLEAEEKRLEENRSNLNRLQGMLETNLAGLKKLSYSDYGLIDVDTIRTEFEQLLNLIQSTNEEFEKLDKEKNALGNEISSVEGSLKRVKNQLSESEQDLKKADSLLKKLLEDSEFDSLEEIRTVLNSDPDTEAIRNRVEQFKTELHSAKERKAKLDADLGEQTFDDQYYAGLETKVAELRDQTDSLIAEAGNATEKLRKLKQDYESKLTLEKQLNAVENRIADLRTLLQLFKGSGFVNYISSVYLRQLCDAANRRFYVLTRQQLRLELSDKNSFEVRDYLNDGRKRSIKTLSGGQTFQASLCLALALAESVQQRNKTEQNFFFLDEGFGSLDKESLQTVFETLKSLRQESRVVGIISHVEELQQEIDVFLNITNNSDEGSLIEGSWA